MYDMNICIFTGRPTRDAEVRKTNEGAEFLSLSIANNGINNSVNFLEMSVFNPKIVETGKKCFKKGVKLMLRTHVDVQPYTDRNGNQRVFTRFIVDDWGFAERKRTEGDQEGYVPASSQAPQYAAGASAPSQGMSSQPVNDGYSPAAQSSQPPAGGYVPASNNVPQGSYYPPNGNFPPSGADDFMNVGDSDLEEELPFN